MSTIEELLQKHALVLPAVSMGAGNYQPFYRVGNLLFLSGQGPRDEDNKLRTGRLGENYTTEQGAQDAQRIGLQLIATAKLALGDLDRVKGVVKILGLVNCMPAYTEQPKVIDGCSKLFKLVLPDAPGHSRSAVGTNSLPGGISVEIEAIFEVD
ncbi:RidA family protein [Pseudomonas sp. CCM 7891]|uniref:RidA family protein n=1 Tax=Pseudomonas karstica TaxID=1055468 RepID=A0A7X2RQV6_9PSED|nr:RidA family protein [Pseudomonas karstica]MTD19309.1 RidA family protein [Pseudomonas karstica]